MKEKTTKIFTSVTTTIWKSRQNEGNIKIQNQVCQQALDFDDTVDVAEATSEGVMKEKFAPHGIICKIAREEAAKQCCCDFARLIESIEKKLVSSLKHNNNNKRSSTPPTNAQHHNKRRTQHSNKNYNNRSTASSNDNTSNETTSPPRAQSPQPPPRSLINSRFTPPLPQNVNTSNFN